ncbi:hypothetical protein MXL46_08380 [Heyndrickxia sporothermodurans]|uniref:Uncharacterized protein n=1 Tax=Heyndrickxia sporothermodurans TaxID=46224 RepID=A0AB37HBB3_9BACI|nr:hypothetical protein [Heyndrickxia sporothermodurans]MED1711745.1 hypothetical protein [Bacillus thuringiensis]MBL5768003.1 hypothetical protein [Heyndrickxia sporothermodurans]MBL5771596.1 hypothetical protein [Heyndrickxia sporothermodurans]MBL5785882.1 hypothetical protein [Heyndrickxia sporothermodurans]MBL5789388.1 hypothetical protein [Heyndrickxia sporothermodurans]
MCNLCNGRHVVHTFNDYSIEIKTCPVCGPKPQELINQENMVLDQKRAEVLAILSAVKEAV